MLERLLLTAVLAAQLSFGTAAQAPAQAAASRWIGTAHTTQVFGGWSCATSFRLDFTILGDKVSGSFRGRVDEENNIEAKDEGYQRTGIYRGKISGANAQGTWRVLGACSGSWSARRVSPGPSPPRDRKDDPRYKTKIIGDRTVEEILLSLESPRDNRRIESVEEVSLDRAELYIVVRWGSYLERGRKYLIQYLIFHPSGRARPIHWHSTTPTVGTWRTWTRIVLKVPRDEPGDWRTEIHLDGRKVAERLFKVLPAR